MDGQNVHCSTHFVDQFLNNVWSHKFLCQSDKSGKADFAVILAKDKLEYMDISLDNIWFLGVRLVANTSNMKICKDIWIIE